MMKNMVAKDFSAFQGPPSKDIAEIMTKYSQTPKNHMQVLEERELAADLRLSDPAQPSGLRT